MTEPIDNSKPEQATAPVTGAPLAGDTAAPTNGAAPASANGTVASVGGAPPAPTNGAAPTPTSDTPAPNSVTGATTELPIAGLGVDIIEVARMERAIQKCPHLPERIFSEAEVEYARSKVNPATHFALFFAAKEAVLKALGTGFHGMRFTDIEVAHDRFGRPYPLLHGQAQKLAEQQGVLEVHLSLSFTHTVGVASAVTIKEQDRPRKDEKIDPRSELAQQFKQMRSLLDDMDERLRGVEKGELADAVRGHTESADTARDRGYTQNLEQSATESAGAAHDCTEPLPLEFPGPAGDS